MRQLPKGTVTFVFTDIEGSTRLLHTLGDRYRDALEQHRTILRAAFTSYSGVEVDTQGDAFFVAFSTPREALQAAIRGQRALAEHPWPQGGELRVRMGIHTGTPEVTEEGYLGSDVHLGARICAAAWGGQILLSPTTAAHVLTSSDDKSLRSLGAHALKDIDERVELLQVIGPGLRADFPPPRTTGSHPTNLPSRLQPLIGRDTELAALTELFARDDVSLVTLVGPGGTGKTRLALASGAELLSSFPDGVFFVDLSALADPALVIGAIAQTLSLRETPGRSLADILTDHLSSKQTLLILDNLEQVIEAATDIATLLTSAPDLKVVVTSRETLQVAGERVLSLNPLEVPSSGEHGPEEIARSPAVALFTERACAVKAGFSLTLENASDVAAICRRLDGLPLAVELAAARVNLLSPSALLARLDSGLKVLSSGRRDTAARQRTLRGAIEWSYELLSQDEQKLFRRLGVFTGGWSLEAAEAVCDRGDLSLDVLSGLAFLVDKSLMRAVERVEERFSMLETIREFAFEKLEESPREAEEIRRAHAEFFRALAEEAEPHLRGPDQKKWLNALEKELDNLRGAMAFSRQRESSSGVLIAASLRRFWWIRGHLSEGQIWLGQALEGSHEQSPDIRAKLLFSSGFLAQIQGEDAVAESRCREALELFGSMQDDAGSAGALEVLGIAAEERGDLDDARRYHEKTLTAYERLNEPRGVAIALGNLSNLALKQHQLREADALAKESLERYRHLGLAEGMAACLINIGLAALEQRNLQQARDALHECLTIATDLGHKELLTHSLIGLAGVASASGEFLEAARFVGAAQRLSDATGAQLPVIEKAVLDRTLEEIRANLSDEAFEEALAEGSTTNIRDIHRVG